MSAGSRQAGRHLGYVPLGAPAYDDMRAQPFLCHVAALRGVPRRRRRSTAQRLVESCGLSAALHQPIGAWPAEFRRRLGLAQALVHDPSVLLLNDPTAGLDEAATEAIEQLLRRLLAGRTALVASAEPQRLQRLCRRTLCLQPGAAGVREMEPIGVTPTAAGGEAADGCLEVIFDSPLGRPLPIAKLARLFGHLPGVRQVAGEQGPHPATAIFRLDVIGTSGLEAPLQAAAQANMLRLRRFRLHPLQAADRLTVPPPVAMPATVQLGLPPPRRADAHGPMAIDIGAELDMRAEYAGPSAAAYRPPEGAGPQGDRSTQHV